MKADIIMRIVKIKAMKNRNHMKIIRLIPVLCLVVLSACKDPMKNYYGDDKYKAPGNQSVMEALNSNPDYSTFAYLMEKTGLDQLFKDNVLMTIWVPLNEDMPADVLTLTEEEQVRMIRNHLSLGSMNTRSLDGQISTSGSNAKIVNMSGRHMPLTRTGGIYSIDGAPLLNTDIICSNGIIQEISEWFLPRTTLYEYVVNLGNEYSLFRDSLLARNVLTFDADSSKTEHVDSTGKPIWDSIFLLSNDVFDYADLNDITKTFTIFVPTNEAVSTMFRDMSNYLLAANYTITSKDTARWMDWLMRTAIQPAQREYVPDREWTNSLWTKSAWQNNNKDKHDSLFTWEDQATYTFRTNFQEVYDPTVKKYLNGWAYEWNKIRVPKTMYLAKVDFNPWRTRNAAGGMNVDINNLDWWGGQVATDAGSGPTTSPTNSVFIQFGRAGFASDGQEEAYYGYKSLKPVTVENEESGEDEEELVALNVMPGYYDIGIRLMNKTVNGLENETDSVTVYVNGSPIVVKNITTNRYNNDDRLIIEDFYISGQYEPVSIEIHLFPTTETDPTMYRAYRRLQVGKTRLIPSESELNYR